MYSWVPLLHKEGFAKCNKGNPQCIITPLFCNKSIKMFQFCLFLLYIIINFQNNKSVGKDWKKMPENREKIMGLLSLGTCFNLQNRLLAWFTYLIPIVMTVHVIGSKDSEGMASCRSSLIWVCAVCLHRNDSCEYPQFVFFFFGELKENYPLIIIKYPPYLSRYTTKPTKWCAPSEDSDQPRHPPSLIRVFAVRSVSS